jgi:hypothetical protein
VDCLSDDLLARCAAGALSAEQIELVEEHVDTCPGCRRLVGDVLRAEDVGDTEPALAPELSSHSASRTQVMALLASKRGGELVETWLRAPPARLGRFRGVGLLGKGGRRLG